MGRPGPERGRPRGGYYTKRTAQAWLDELLLQARRGELPGMVETGATLADAVAEWVRYCKHDRVIKPSTLSEYRNRANRILHGRPLKEHPKSVRTVWSSGLGPGE